jgi:hypothetical protein
MGVALGAGLGTWLIVGDVANVLAMIRHGAQPLSTAAVLVGSLAAIFGVGAGLVGWILDEIDAAQ